MYPRGVVVQVLLVRGTFDAFIADLRAFDDPVVGAVAAFR
jgi:hypothetical protein